MPQSKPMEMEMSESEEVRIEISSNLPGINNNGVIKEWEGCLRAKETNKRKWYIQKVPPLLLKSEKGLRNHAYYKPAVVSLGPYHPKRTDLAQGEKYKLITLEEYRLSSGKTMSFLYNKVVEVIHEARSCYIDGSTDDYNDEEFSRLMLRDGCFILFFIECISCGYNKVLLNNEYLGALGFANITRVIFLLENQIPFVVLKVLLEFRFADKGEDILNGFFNYLNYDEVFIKEDKKVFENKQPLHLLELYRSYFISLSASLGLDSINHMTWRGRSHEYYNYVLRNRSFASITELKANWIFLNFTYDESSNEDIKFHSYCSYGEIQLVRRAVSSNTKSIYKHDRVRDVPT